MAYVDTPIATDGKNKSQGEIKQNFIELDAIISVDHEAFTAAVGTAGKHKQVRFPDMTIDAAHPLETSATEVMLYSDAGKLKLRPPGQAAGVQTGEFNLTPSAVGHATNGYEVLPSGLKIAWGFAAITGAGTNVPYPGGGFAATPYSVTISKSGNAGTQDFVHVGTNDAGFFTGYSYSKSGASTNVNIYFIAIGRA